MGMAESAKTGENARWRSRTARAHPFFDICDLTLRSNFLKFQILSPLLPLNLCDNTMTTPWWHCDDTVMTLWWHRYDTMTTPWRHIGLQNIFSQCHHAVVTLSSQCCHNTVTTPWRHIGLKNIFSQCHHGVFTLSSCCRHSVVTITITKLIE